VSDQVGQLVVCHLAQFGSGEFGEQGGTGRAEEVGEGLDVLPIAALEEGVSLKAHFSLRQGAGELEAVAGEAA
jgi:hypothetical protein